MSDPGSLKNLYDIITPEPVAWLPPAPGWYVSAVIALYLIISICLHRFRIWRRNKYRREALAELNRLADQVQNRQQRETALRAMPVLLKRTALAAFRRDTVASLSGRAWLKFLDKTGSTDAFTRGTGRLLPKLAYLSSAAIENISSNQIAELVTLMREWIKKHASSEEISVKL